MEEIINAIQTPYFWFSVVVVGIVVNWIAGFLLFLFSRVSRKFKIIYTERNEREKKRFELKVSYFVDHPDELKELGSDIKSLYIMFCNLAVLIGLTYIMVKVSDVPKWMDTVGFLLFSVAFVALAKRWLKVVFLMRVDDEATKRIKETKKLEKRRLSKILQVELP